MHTDINRLPVVDLRDETKMAEIIPSPTIRGMATAAHGALTNILAKLPPEGDPAPMAMTLGWDTVQPTCQVIAIDGRFMRNGETKTQLAFGLRDMILRERAMEKETYAVALINAAWFKSEPRNRTPEGIEILRGRIEQLDRQGISGEPDKIETINVNIIWQDGQRILLNAVRRREGQPPMLGSWHDLSAGSVMIKDRFWHTIAPALANVSFAEAVLAAFEQEKGGEAL